MPFAPEDILEFFLGLLIISSVYGIIYASIWLGKYRRWFFTVLGIIGSAIFVYVLVIHDIIKFLGNVTDPFAHVIIIVIILMVIALAVNLCTGVNAFLFFRAGRHKEISKVTNVLLTLYHGIALLISACYCLTFMLFLTQIHKL